MKIHRSLLIAAGTALFASTAAAAEEAQPQMYVSGGWGQASCVRICVWPPSYRPLA